MSADRTLYNKTVWQNDVTALNQSNLNNLELGVEKNNLLSRENALFIDEIFTALISQLSFTFDQETGNIQISIGSATGDNPTERFHVTKQATINTHDSTASDYVLHKQNTSNPHSVTKAQVGLGNVDNTSDADKPVSTAQQLALNTKADDNAVTHLTGNEEIGGDKTLIGALKFKSSDTPNVIAILQALAGGYLLLTGEIFKGDNGVNNKLVSKAEAQALVDALSTLLTNGTTMVKKAEKDANGNDISATYETKSDATAKVTKANLLSILGTNALSSTDRTKLDTLFASFLDDNSNNIVDTLHEILTVFQNYPQGTDLANLLAGKIATNKIKNDFTSTDATEVLSAPKGAELDSRVKELEYDFSNRWVLNCRVSGTTLEISSLYNVLKYQNEKLYIGGEYNA